MNNRSGSYHVQTTNKNQTPGRKGSVLLYDDLYSVMVMKLTWELRHSSVKNTPEYLNLGMASSPNTKFSFLGSTSFRKYEELVSISS